MEFPGGNLVFPFMPESVEVSGGTSVGTRDLVSLTNVTMSEGPSLRTVSFTALLPMDPSRTQAIIAPIRNLVHTPDVYVQYMRGMMAGAKPARLAVARHVGDTATTLWSLPVTLRSLSVAQVGGQVHAVGYTCEFTEHYELDRPDINTEFIRNYSMFLETNTEAKLIRYSATNLNAAPSTPPPPPSTNPPAPDPDPPPAPTPAPERAPVSKIPPADDPPIFGLPGERFPYRTTFKGILPFLVKTFPNAQALTLGSFVKPICEYNKCDYRGYYLSSKKRAKVIVIPPATYQRLQFLNGGLGGFGRG